MWYAYSLRTGLSRICVIWISNNYTLQCLLDHTLITVFCIKGLVDIQCLFAEKLIICWNLLRKYPMQYANRMFIFLIKYLLWRPSCYPNLGKLVCMWLKTQGQVFYLKNQIHSSTATFLKPRLIDNYSEVISWSN